MVLPESADRDLISRTAANSNASASSSLRNFTSSIDMKMKTLPPSPSKTGAKLISYQVAPKPPPPPLPLPHPVRVFLNVCCGSNMKWFSFPLCCAFSMGLFLAFSRASTYMQISNKGYHHFINSRQLSDDEPHLMPGTGLFGDAKQLQPQMWAPAPACDCSKCLEREDIYNPGHPQYRTLIKHSLQHSYGHQDIALHMSSFVPYKRTLWNLGFALYTTASSQCSAFDDSNNLLAVVLVMSKPENLEQRQVIRQTWGSVGRDETWPNAKTMPGKARVVFVMGTSDDQRYNDVMLHESRTYGDMVLADVKEDKGSVTKKVLSGMKWVEMYCSHAQHIIKVEDHVFLDLPRVLDVLANQDISNMIYGSIIYVKAVPRDQNRKHDPISYAAYSVHWFPPYALGDFYIIPTKLSKRMLGVAMNLPYVPLDDVYITGILAKVFDARHINVPSNLFDEKGTAMVGLCDIVSRSKMVVKNVTPEVANSFWKRIQRPHMCGLS